MISSRLRFAASRVAPRVWKRPALACVFALAGLAAARAAAPVEDQPLIPRSVLLGNPERVSPLVSPDGVRLAYVAPDDKNVLQVWVATLGKSDAKQVTHDPKRGVRQFQWAEDSQHVLYLQDRDGDENFHLYGVDLSGSAARDYTPAPGVCAQILGTDRKHPTEVLVSLNERDKRVFDVARIDLSTGAKTLDTQNPGDVAGWVVDPEFRVRGATAFTPDGGLDIRVRASVDAEWKTLVHFGAEDAGSTPYGFTADGKSLWLGTSAGSDTLRLVKRDVETGKETVIAEDSGSDLRTALVNGDTHEIDAVAFGRMRIEWRAIDPSLKGDFESIAKAFDGDPAIQNRDRANSTWIVAYTNDHGPVPFYAYDRKTKKSTFLFTNQGALEKFSLARMKPVEIQARDGMKLPSYLTIPVGSNGKNLPMVLDVHGGPWARDQWGYNPEHQWLSNRGYAVLSVNFRGSTGFGKKHLHAGDREWGAKMHDDLLDAVSWAVKEGIADPKRVAIYGGSYGGYAALVGATFTPDTFACAVDIVGPSNLATLLQSIPPYWAPIKVLFETRMGRLDEPEFLKARSPLYKADKIKIPMLIAQGKNDPRVNQRESEQIVAAMYNAGKPVEYLLFEDEGHGFARPENRMKFYAAAESFLAKHLGGRAVPPGPSEEPPRVSPADVAKRANSAAGQ